MNTPAKSNARPFKVTENGRTLASAATLRGARIATARRIYADITDRVVVIVGPGVREVARVSASGMGITYTAEAV